MRRLLTLIASYFLIAVSASHAQVVPDDSLPNNSVVNGEQEVTEGTTAGSNLFHSFEEFSVDTGETVFFDNAATIENIISRVTGSNVSNIDGLLRANGTADLFLINPNGIIFGENAALDIGGSFISSTAESIQFADGTEFSAANPDATPLLTVNIPVGLQYGNSPGDITVRGSGNNLTIDPDTVTVDRSNRPVGLEVDDGNTLALLGGNVFLPGGNLTAAEGRAAVGSVDGNSFIRLTPDSLGWSFNYAEVSNFQEINLSEAASVDVSGNGGGEVRFQGREIELAGGSAILANTLGDDSGEVLSLSATENIELEGFNSNNSFPTRLSTDVEPDAVGDGGELSIDTNNLLIAGGAQVTSGTFGLGNAGDLKVVASSDVEVLDESEGGEFFSGLFTQADIEETGDGGDLRIEANSLLVADGAEISTNTFGSGKAGNLDIEADTVELRGFSESLGSGSGLFVATEAEGSGGDLNVETNSLRVLDGAQVSTTTFGSGNSGNLKVTASEIELGGRLSGSENPGGLFANAEVESSGDSGNLIIETDNLSINDGAQILASTNSVGNAGTISINSQKIDLVGTSADGVASAISADAVLSEGAGGNIVIDTESIEISEGAQISTITSGTGDGGSLNINASDFVRVSGASESGSSGLFANAPESDGAGGNLIVQTDSLSVLDGATISVSNFPSGANPDFDPGQGAAGNLTIDADEILLEDSSTITADTFTGDRGNINLQTDLLFLRRGSQISTNAQETATGGNITIEAPDGLIAAYPEENSDITANAVRGDGGRVDIEALSILGIEPRASLTPLSDITTSSEFGIDGNINLQIEDLNPVENLGRLPNALNPPQLAQGCEAGAKNSGSFVDIGQGGLNSQPDEALGGTDVIGDVELPQAWKEDKAKVVEAEDWVVNDRGKVELVASAGESLYDCELN